MMKTPLLGLLLLASNASAAPTLMFYDTFPSGGPTAGKWVDGMLPWNTSLVAHSPLTVGGGDGMFWDRAWPNYTVSGTPGSATLRCAPLSATDRGTLGRQIAAQAASTALAAAVRGTSHRCALLSATAGVPLFGSTFETSFTPGGGASWTAFWVYPSADKPLPRAVGTLKTERDTRAELDIGEVTIQPTGVMLVRLVGHYALPNGVWLTKGCTVEVPQGRAITTRAEVSATGVVTMKLNGEQACPTFQMPSYGNVTVSPIIDIQMGGPSQIPVTPVSTSADWNYVKVTRP